MDGRMIFRGRPSLGVVYTKPSVVLFILDLIGYVPSKNILDKRILDVGCGYGQFIGEIARRFALSCKKQGLDCRKAIDLAKENLCGIEIDQKTANAAGSRIHHEFDTVYGSRQETKQIGKSIVRVADFLDWNRDNDEFDFVVGNLPYVKYDAIKNLPRAKNVDWIRTHFECFRGRADYSVAFVEKTLRILSKRGTAGVVTSNRFTQSEYGKSLRVLLANDESHLDELDLSDVSAFDDDVTAYASVFLLERGSRGASHYVKLTSMDNQGLKKLSRSGLAGARSTRWFTACSRGALPRDGSPWPPLPGRVISILKRLERRFPTVEDLGFAVSTGPATGANDVFVRSYDEFPLTTRTRERYLLPLYSSRSSGPSSSESLARYLLSVYEGGTRRLLDLDEMPGDMQDYLLDNRSVLESRYVVRNEGREWWGGIDSYDPGLLRKHKVLIPDLQHGVGIRFDKGRLFPDHTVIYATGTPRGSHRLAVVLKSPVVDLIRIWKSPVMKGGVPRASSKVIANLPCPDLTAISNWTSNADYSEVYEGYGLTRGDIDMLERSYSLASGSP